MKCLEMELEFVRKQQEDSELKIKLLEKEVKDK
jgi:hypothetical protein